jgi:hypothetical protein
MTTEERLDLGIAIFGIIVFLMLLGAVLGGSFDNDKNYPAPGPGAPEATMTIGGFNELAI